MVHSQMSKDRLLLGSPQLHHPNVDLFDRQRRRRHRSNRRRRFKTPFVHQISQRGSRRLRFGYDVAASNVTSDINVVMTAAHIKFWKQQCSKTKKNNNNNDDDNNNNNNNICNQSQYLQLK